MGSLDEMRALVRRKTNAIITDGDIEAVIQGSNDLPVGTVRVWREDIRQTVRVKGTVRTVGLDVILRYDGSGRLYIARTNVEPAAQKFSDAVGAAEQPPIPDEVIARSVTADGLTIGRLEPSQTGGLYVHVKAFAYGNSYWRDYTQTAPLLRDYTAYDIDLTGDVPATSGHSGWVAVYLDPVAAAADPATAIKTEAGATAVLSENVASLLDEDAFAIVIPYGCYLIGFVGLTYGQTNFTATTPRFLSGRSFLSPVLPPYYAIAVDTTEVGNIGTGEDDLIVYSLPANTLAYDGDRLKAEAAVTLVANADVRAYFGSTSIFDSTALSVSGTNYASMNITIIRKSATSQVCIVHWASTVATLTSETLITDAAEDLSTALVLKLTAEATNDDDVIQKYLTVDLVRAS